MGEEKVTMLNAGKDSIFFWSLVSFLAPSPVWRLPRAVSQFSCDKHLVPAQRKLRSHQKASIEVGETAHLK